MRPHWMAYVLQPVGSKSHQRALRAAQNNPECHLEVKGTDLEHHGKRNRAQHQLGKQCTCQFAQSRHAWLVTEQPLLKIHRFTWRAAWRSRSCFGIQFCACALGLVGARVGGAGEDRGAMVASTGQRTCATHSAALHDTLADGLRLAAGAFGEGDLIGEGGILQHLPARRAVPAAATRPRSLRA